MTMLLSVSAYSLNSVVPSLPFRNIGVGGSAPLCLGSVLQPERESSDWCACSSRFGLSIVLPAGFPTSYAMWSLVGLIGLVMVSLYLIYVSTYYHGVFTRLWTTYTHRVTALIVQAHYSRLALTSWCWRAYNSCQSVPILSLPSQAMLTHSSCVGG